MNVNIHAYTIIKLIEYSDFLIIPRLDDHNTAIEAYIDV